MYSFDRFIKNFFDFLSVLYQKDILLKIIDLLGVEK